MRRYREPNWPRLMSIESACAYLSTSDKEGFLAKIAPCLRPIKLPDGAIRYDARDLDAWADAGGNIAPKRSDEDWLQEISNAKN